MNPIQAIIFNDTRPAIHFGCERVMDNLLLLLQQSNIEPIHLHSTFDFWENQTHWVKEKIQACDIVIVNGEGSIHHANAKAASLSSIGPLAKSLGKPAILLNATLYQNNQDIYKNIAVYDAVYVRDAYSASEFAAYGGTARYAPDLTFFTDISSSKNFEDTGCATDTLQILVGESVLKNTTSQLTQLAQKNNYQQLHIHHDNTPKLSIDRHWDSMRSADLIITGRFHTVCFCINMGIPFVALESNTNKISNLLNDCFQSTRRLLTHTQIADTDWQAFAIWTAFEKKSISDFKNSNQKRFQALINDLKALTSKTT